MPLLSREAEGPARRSPATGLLCKDRRQMIVAAGAVLIPTEPEWFREMRDLRGTTSLITGEDFFCPVLICASPFPSTWRRGNPIGPEPAVCRANGLKLAQVRVAAARRRAFGLPETFPPAARQILWCSRAGGAIRG